MVELKSIRRYDFSDGTVIHVELDFENNKISFLEPANSLKGDYVPKHWLFAGRGAEYMNGWINIFRCMEYAAVEAKRELEDWQAAQKKKKADRMIDILIVMSETRGNKK